MRYFAASFAGAIGAAALIAIPDDRIALPLFFVLMFVVPALAVVTDKNIKIERSDRD